MNRQIVMLSRVVLHPTYRGAGIAADFVRRSCESCGSAWVEVLAEMGRIHPLFSRAGFQRVEVCGHDRQTRASHAALYGTRREGYGKKRLISQESFEKSRHAQPAYFIFDNRERCRGEGEQQGFSS